jgi:hypothetical protein
MNFDPESVRESLAEILPDFLEQLNRVILDAGHRERGGKATLAVAVKIKDAKLNAVATIKTTRPTGTSKDETIRGVPFVLGSWSLDEAPGQTRIEGT